jgi:hypothetical protein
MPVVSTELLESRDTVLSGNTYEYTQIYHVVGTSDPPAAAAVFEGLVQPLIVNFRKLYKKSIKARLISLPNETCEVETVWTTNNRYATVEHNGSADTEFVTMSMTGQTTHITHVEAAADQTHYYEDLGTGIGKNGDDTLNGVDVMEPTESLEIRINKKPSTINAAYRSALRAVYMHTNNATWKGYGAGSLLFTGVQYANTTDVLMSVTFNFLARPSATLTPTLIGDLGGSPNPPTITKKGWQYYWIRTGLQFDFSPGAGINDPKNGIKSAHVADVYPSATYASAFALDATKLFATD